MKTLICGFGEIGKGLAKVLSDYKPFIHDSHKGYNFLTNDTVDIMHICFGYDENFIEQVKKYQEEYKPKYTIIHSTVPRGTSRQLNSVSSPCICQHPFIEEGLRTFPKMLGGKQASEVADYFRRAGMKVYICDNQETLELGKISQTTFYALMIEYVKDLKKRVGVLERKVGVK